MTDNLAVSDDRVNKTGCSKNNQHIFIVCKIEPRGERTEKMPCNRHGVVTSIHTADRMSHDDAKRLASELGGQYRAGVILNGDGRFCIDLDNALQQDNTWSPLATELCTQFAGCFIEVSNSGRGLHIFGYSNSIPAHSSKNVPLHIELYSTDRFICLGSMEQGDMFFDASAPLNAVVSRYFPANELVAVAEWTTTHCEGSNPIQDDEKLIAKAHEIYGKAEKAFTGDSTFARLWSGDLTDYDGDASSADAAMAQYLTFMTGNNCERIERLMRKSALVREKWDNHKSYMQRTILGAVSRQSKWYSVGATCQMALPVPDVQPFEALQVAKGTCPHNDHVLDADILRTSVFHNRLVDFSGAAYWWNGQKWEFAEDSLMRRYVGESMVRAMGQDGPKVTQSRINGTLAVMRDRLDRMGAINPVSRLVFFRNGALDVDTGELIAHNPENRNSNVLSCDYSPSASCKVWQAWLAEIFASDLERVQLLQEIIGWSLITDNLGIQKAPIFIGAQRAGKGTILHVVSTLLNDAAGAFQLPNLDNDKVLAGMTQRNVVIDYDTASPDKKNSRQIVGLFKAITANEPVSVKLLYTQVPFQGALNCKLLLASNSVPTMWDDSTATANRWLPLVFDRSFLGDEDTTLSKRLVEELPGIAQWALEGLRRLMSNGRFTMPKTSLNEMDYMVESGSPVTRFMEEECVFEQTARVADNALWSRYQQWCIANGMEQMKRKNFLQAFKDASVSQGVRSAKSVRIGEGIYRGFHGVNVKPVVFEQNVTPLAAIR